MLGAAALAGLALDEGSLAKEVGEESSSESEEETERRDDAGLLLHHTIEAGVDAEAVFSQWTAPENSEAEEEAAPAALELLDDALDDLLNASFDAPPAAAEGALPLATWAAGAPKDSDAPELNAPPQASGGTSAAGAAAPGAVAPGRAVEPIRPQGGGSAPASADSAATTFFAESDSGGSGGGDSGGTSGGSGGATSGGGCSCDPPANTPPTVINSSVSIDEDSSWTVNVLANAAESDDGQSTFVTKVSQGAHGKVHFTIDHVVYEPNENWSGSDQFTYTVKDGHGGSATATVDVTVNAVDDAPVAGDDFVTLNEGGSVVIDLLQNDSDAEGSVTLDEVAANSYAGNLVADNGDGTVTYTPWYYDGGGPYGGGFYGWDYFSYQVKDTPGNTDAGRVDVYVSPDNPPASYNGQPKVFPDRAKIDEGQAVVNFDVLGNDFDPEGSTLSLYGDPSLYGMGDGTYVGLTANGDGTINYDPPANFPAGHRPATVSISYSIIDAGGATDAADVADDSLVLITVNPVNDSPAAADDNDIEVWAGDSVQIPVRANDTDAEDGDALIVIDAAQGAKGRVTFDGRSVTYTPNPDAFGNDTFTYTVADGYGETDIATVNVEIKRIDLDAKTISHNAAAGDLDEREEECKGTYVPINNDDDDYDAGNTSDVNQVDPATNQPVAITDEDDLMPITLRSIEPAALGGKYTLAIPANVRIWKNANRSDAVNGMTQFDATADTTLYVEGSSVGTGEIRVNWTNGTDSRANADRVKVTTFSWTGPLNVPGHAMYKYSATGAADGVGNSKWIAPGGGTDVLNQQVMDASGEDFIMIRWDGGPAVGKASYQASPDYVWDLEVNVVDVAVSAPATGASFDAGVPRDAGTFVNPNGVLIKLAYSGWIRQPGAPGLSWQAHVTLTGPNGGRGVKFMRVGFIQNLTAYQNRGTYNDAGVTLAANIEKLTPLLDHVDASAGPWYVDAGAGVFFNPTPGAGGVASKTISSSDTPGDGPPLTADQGGTVAAGDDILDTMTLQDTFELNIAAQTTDARNGATQVFTRMAKAEWVFNGDGTIGQAAPYTWTAAATAGVTAPMNWTIVTDASRPLTTGNTFNDELKRITYAIHAANI